MPSHIELQIPGAVKSGKPLEVCAPYDNTLLATVDTADSAAVEQALTTAYTLFRDRSQWLSKAQRIDILKKTAQLMGEQSDALALAAAEEGGKPLIDSQVEIDRAIDGIHNCIECLRTAAASTLSVGAPTAAATEVGPLIRPREVTRVHEWVTEVVQAGAGLLCDGEVLSESCYAPTVLLDPPQDTKVSQLEIFGPVMCIYSYDDIDEAIVRANALDVAFQAAVFTRSLDTALQCYRQLDASAVMVNDHTAFRVDWMPFAGLRHSGLGVGGIPYTFHDMQIEKMLVVKSGAL